MSFGIHKSHVDRNSGSKNQNRWKETFFESQGGKNRHQHLNIQHLSFWDDPKSTIHCTFFFFCTWDGRNVWYKITCKIRNPPSSIVTWILNELQPCIIERTEKWPKKFWSVSELPVSQTLGNFLNGSKCWWICFGNNASRTNAFFSMENFILGLQSIKISQIASFILKVIEMVEKNGYYYFF